MTRNKDKYIFYSSFVILLLTFVINMIIALKSICLGAVNRCLTTSLLMVLFICTTMVFLFTIYRRCRKDDARENYIANVIHDCKTPITTINLVCQTLNDVDVDSEENLRYYSDIVKTETSKLIMMIENVLNFMRLNNENLDYNQKVDIHKVINDSVNSMGFLVRSLDGNIMTCLHSDSHYVKGNYDVLLSIIDNIIHNAIKYTECPPRIIVATKEIDGNMEISISDNGIGMEEHELKNIFDKTYRISSSRTDVGGSGLGLYHAKENIERLSGKITVVSSYGNGSEFRITLPIVK